MVVDEAHFIKNKQSQRSQNVLNLSDRIRARIARPLLMALTGTPLINDIEDFQAIWEFLGWIDDKKPLAKLMDKLEETGLTPADPGLLPRRPAAPSSTWASCAAARSTWPPTSRPAGSPTCPSSSTTTSAAPSARPSASSPGTCSSATTWRSPPVVPARPSRASTTSSCAASPPGSARTPATTKTDGDNVFTMLRRIGQAKAGLAADYAAQLARSVGKVVFFAKHVDVMDLAGDTFEKRGIRYSEIRGDQTPKAREANIKAFQEDPDVQIIVCSLMAAGVGINLQVASNVVLAELSWTDAEQTQAIDRVHRIGQAEPVTAWRIIASQTIDTKIAELIDSKAGLAARALDGSDEEVGSLGGHPARGAGRAAHRRARGARGAARLTRAASGMRRSRTGAVVAHAYAVHRSSESGVGRAAEGARGSWCCASSQPGCRRAATTARSASSSGATSSTAPTARCPTPTSGSSSSSPTRPTTRSSATPTAPTTRTPTATATW